MNNYIIKKKNNYGIYFHGLSKYHSFLLEYNCLNKLNKNYECICRDKVNHFPKIINVYLPHYKFMLTRCGRSLNKLKKRVIITNLDEQLNCIIHNLYKNNIKHLDMTSDGKNMCIDENGTIAIIDFDISSINNKYASNKIYKRFTRRYGTNKNYYKKFREKMFNILKDNKFVKILKNSKIKHFNKGDKVLYTKHKPHQIAIVSNIILNMNNLYPDYEITLINGKTIGTVDKYLLRIKIVNDKYYIY